MGQKNSYAIVGLFLTAAIILGSCIDGDRTTGTFIADPSDTVTPGSWTTDFIRDYSYVDGRIFDLAYPGEIGPHDLVEVLVFEEETRVDNPDAIEVYFQTGPLDTTGMYDAPSVSMRELSPVNYEIMYGRDITRCPAAIVFYSSRRLALGVIIEITRMNEAGDTTGLDTIGYRGGGAADDTIRVLKPLARDLLPSNPAWSLMWRNCYRVPRNVAIEELDVDIFKGLPGTEGSDTNLDYQEVGGVVEDPYIKILGLDQWDNSIQDTKLPDGKLDDRVEVYRPEWGLVIFPHREPFNTDTTFVDANAQRSDFLEFRVPALYDYLSRVEKVESSRYYFQISTWQPDYPCR